ncbi:MAG: Uncharacterized protein XD74_2144 [Actinobacteria bacterium 66_15]|nr:MAG: Uncharacterized protein XD74_2144 [Actinobacteria bacterium 66_15]
MGNAARYSLFPLRDAVHPHVHGERRAASSASAAGCGSSPRAWGTLAIPGGRRTGIRFIPTCMGNARCTMPTPPSMAVHPHVHGERAAASAHDVAVLDPPVHPHVHGERSIGFWETAGSDGSSPRAWGTPCAAGPAWRRHRFIPTCMGNAQPSRAFSQRRAVHPHVHGERTRSTGGDRMGVGSSPRAWGTPWGRRSGGPISRFIPTCMGNARACRITLCSLSVHPHVHGERII